MAVKKTTSRRVTMSDFESAKKAKGTTLSTSDIVKMKKWITFIEAIDKTFEDMDSAYVTMGFETSLDAKTHYTFTPDEAVFPSNVFISQNGYLTFKVISGKSYKTFNYRESELVEVTLNGETLQLNDIIDNLFEEHCGKGLGYANIDDLERFCLKNKDYITYFNDSRMILDKMEEQEKAKKAYETVANYGCF